MDLQGKHLDYALNGRVLLCTGVILFVAIITVLCFHNYVRILFGDGRRRYIRHRARQLLAISTPGGGGGATSTTTGASKGLDSSVIKTIPIIVYAATPTTPLECSVCLSEFETDERASVLPKCNHTFHVDCIAMWFFSHSNCPLCRATVQAFIPVQTVAPVVETAGLESEQDIETNSYSASSSSSSSLEIESCPMKKVEVVGILVEVPTGTSFEIGFGSKKDIQRTV